MGMGSILTLCTDMDFMFIQVFRASKITENGTLALLTWLTRLLCFVSDDTCKIEVPRMYSCKCPGSVL